GWPQGHALRPRQNPRRADGAGAGDGESSMIVQRPRCARSPHGRRSRASPRQASSYSRSRGMRAPSEQDIVAGNVLLAVENVSLAFGGVKAVAGVSFDIRKGEIRAIIGPNGAGKTSMLNVINGFYHPQQGRITFKGKPRAAMRPYEAALG